MRPPEPVLCYCPACGLPGITSWRSGNSLHACLWSDGYLDGHMLPKENALLVHQGCGHYVWHNQLHYRLPEQLAPDVPAIRSPAVRTAAHPESPHPFYRQVLRNPYHWNYVIELIDESPRSYFSGSDWRNTLGEFYPELIGNQLNPVDTAAEWELAWQLGAAGPQKRNQRFLLTRWWWAINHLDPVWNEELQSCQEPPPRDMAMLQRCLSALVPLLGHASHRLFKAEALRELGRFEEAEQVFGKIETARLKGDSRARYALIGRLLGERSLDLDFLETEDFAIYI